MQEQSAMARSAERGMASRGRRNALLTIGGGGRAFGDGAQTRAEASSVTTLGTGANDEGAHAPSWARDRSGSRLITG